MCNFILVSQSRVHLSASGWRVITVPMGNFNILQKWVYERWQNIWIRDTAIPYRVSKKISQTINGQCWKKEGTHDNGKGKHSSCSINFDQCHDHMSLQVVQPQGPFCLLIDDKKNPSQSEPLTDRKKPKELILHDYLAYWVLFMAPRGHWRSIFSSFSMRSLCTCSHASPQFMLWWTLGVTCVENLLLTIVE